VAVDDSHIYWTTPIGIGRANLDGTGIDRRFITNEDGYITSNVAVDATHIYWATTTGFFSFRGNDTVARDVQKASIPNDEADPLAIAIARANLDGSGVDRGFIAPSRTGLRFGDETTLAVNGAHIYWTTSAGITRANLDGTDVDASFITDWSFTFGGRPSAPAVDNAHIYWTAAIGIGRANLDGTGVDPTFITWPPCRDGRPRGLAVDGAHLYWSSREEPPPLGGNRFALGKVKRNATKVRRASR
jgi:hypothetical protein